MNRLNIAHKDLDNWVFNTLVGKRFTHDMRYSEHRDEFCDEHLEGVVTAVKKSESLGQSDGTYNITILKSDGKKRYFTIHPESMRLTPTGLVGVWDHRMYPTKYPYFDKGVLCNSTIIIYDIDK